jgi:lipoprotein-releasing system ATP-binding protein
MMIRGENIHKSYQSLHVLKGVDIEIGKGEIVSIVGKSGAGKTTLLHILGTLDKADKGRILYNQENISLFKDQKISQFRNQHIGFIFQFHHLLDEFSAIENVCVPAFLYDKRKVRIHKRAEELLQYLGLGDRLDHRPAELSGGEQQRVAIARAIMNEPEVIFADEPTGNLDSQNSEEIHTLLFNLRADLGHTLVIVTHNRDLASRCDRTLLMEDGKIIQSSKGLG